MKIKKALITAAGFGSRFLPITKSFPKEMLPIINKPIIHHLVEECIHSGIEEIIIVANTMDINKFEDYFFGQVDNIKELMFKQNKLDRWAKVQEVFDLKGLKIIAQDDNLPYGNGRPVLSAKSLLENEEAFVVMFGDDMVIAQTPAVKQLIDYYYANPCDGLLGVQEVDLQDVTKYGVVERLEGTQNQVKRVVEKPEIDAAPSNMVTYGRFIMTPKIFEYLNSNSTGKDDELWLQDANDKVAKNGKVLFHHIQGEWITTGDPSNYVEAYLKYSLLDDQLKSTIEDFIKNLNS